MIQRVIDSNAKRQEVIYQEMVERGDLSQQAMDEIMLVHNMHQAVEVERAMLSISQRYATLYQRLAQHKD